MKKSLFWSAVFVVGLLSLGACSDDNKVDASSGVTYDAPTGSGIDAGTATADAKPVDASSPGG